MARRSPLAGTARSHIVRYGAALAFATLALGVNFLLPDASPANRWFLFVIAVLATAVYGGFVPGLLATFASAAMGSYFFLTPAASLRVERADDIELLAIFIVEGAVISGVGHLRQKTPSTRMRPAWFRYGLAAGAAAVAAGIKLAAFQTIAPRVPFLFCFAIVVASAWALGAGPALGSTAVSALSGYFLIPRTSPMPVEERVMLFVLEATVLSFLASGYGTVLMRKQAYLTRLFFESPAGILVLRPDFQVLKANPAASEMLSCQRSGVEGANLADLLHPSSRECLMASLRGLERGGGPISAHEIRFQSNGKLTWTELQAATIELPGERERGWLLTVADVTDRHDMERLLLETESRLHQAQKLEAVGLLASSIAHDFNNQLAVILGYSEDLLKKRSSDEVVRSDAEEISRASRKAGEFTRQLLRFARKEMRKPEPIDLNRVVDECRLFLSRLLGDNITLVTELDPRLAPVRADPAQVEQILMNLIANARDAMPHGGKLVVRTANVSFAEAVSGTGATIPAGQYAALAVIDSGQGMDAAVLRRIFEPFFTTKAPGQGTGLGLATVHRNTQHLGGHILVESTPGAGTVVTVYLPKAGDVCDVPNEKPEAVPAAPRTVLVVEADDGLRALMAQLLKTAGYVVLDAASGEDALAMPAASEGGVELLVSEAPLPGPDGARLASQLQMANPNMRVLYVSDHPAQEKLEPRTPFLAKPFTPAALVAAVAGQLGNEDP